MIKNKWYAILESKEVKKKPVGIVRMGEKLVLYRDEKSQIICLFDKCCHRGAKLSLGCVKDGQLECPFHGFLYDEQGRVTYIPANGKASKIAPNFKVNSYQVTEKYGFIWLWYSEKKDGLEEEIPYFEELKTGFYYSTFSEVWNVHYTRAIENQLDVVHVPFVHASTIGKGGRTKVNGPVVKWEKDIMTFYVNNVIDDELTPALKANEVKNYKNLFSLQYYVPNIWQNRINDKIRIFAAFAPIDEGHTKIYLRFYQSFLPIPILGHFVTNIANIYNKIVLHQDRAVVLSQDPIKSDLKMREMLVPGDKPIIEFRKKMAQLKSQENQDTH